MSTIAIIIGKRLDSEGFIADSVRVLSGMNAVEDAVQTLKDAGFEPCLENGDRLWKPVVDRDLGGAVWRACIVTEMAVRDARVAYLRGLSQSDG
jgi:hypothetical protein